MAAGVSAGLPRGITGRHMTTMLKMESPEKPDAPVDSPAPEEEPSKRDRPPAPDGPIPAEAPEVPADEPQKEG
jgi:hypothetical protein